MLEINIQSPTECELIGQKNHGRRIFLEKAEAEKRLPAVTACTSPDRR